jgi:PAS domain S-box-containing protein
MADANDTHETPTPLAAEVEALRRHVALLQDRLTAQTHREAALQKTVSHLRLACELSLDAFTILRSIRDTSGQIVDFAWEYANPAAATFLRRPVEALLGHRLLSVLPGNQTNSELFAEYVRVVETGAPLDRELYYNADGIDGWFWNKTVKVGDGVANFFSDITSRKRVEELERRRAEEWMTSLIEATQDAVISIDRHARIVLFNPSAEKIFGYREDEVRGQKVNLLMAEPYAGEHDGYIERYERTQEPRAIGRIRVVAARRKNGDVFPIELSVTEIHTDQEVHYAAFIRDISEKVRLQEQLLDNERLATIGTTAAKLAHEIGNPLNSMSITLQLLQRRLRSYETVLDDKVYGSMRAFEEQIRRLTNLLGEFRSLSRRQHIELKSLDVMTLVQDILTAEAPLYEERKIVVEQNIEPATPPVLGDAEKLKQVILNLCKNAVEAMPEGGTLTVCARCEIKQICLEISDTGVGIPPGVNIFEPFVTTKAAGTGLGLPIAHYIIAAHHGALTYTSEPGRGTTFRLTLPLATEDDAGKHS